MNVYYYTPPLIEPKECENSLRAFLGLCDLHMGWHIGLKQARTLVIRDELDRKCICHMYLLFISINIAFMSYKYYKYFTCD